MSLVRRRLLVLACFSIVSVFAPRAHAQQYILGGSAGLATGIAGGGGENSVLERARTRIRLAVDLRVDEFPKDIFAIAMVAELEPHASVGLDLRYLRMLSKKIEVNAGAIGFLYPASLIGPVAGANYHLPIGTTGNLVVGPEFNVFVIGTDLPSNSVIWQALLQVGFHVDL